MILLYYPLIFSLVLIMARLIEPKFVIEAKSLKPFQKKIRNYWY